MALITLELLINSLELRPGKGKLELLTLLNKAYKLDGANPCAFNDCRGNLSRP
ncbi:hypothetical protein J6590_037562 [Homalodisca vitripennis]|nr:hypothetical protein J6590_037562 [Homalodisca vitripennis]